MLDYMGCHALRLVPLHMLRPRRAKLFKVPTYQCTDLSRLQVRFALSSSAVFSRSDTITDSEGFYNSVLELFYDIEEKQEVDSLLLWWDQWKHFSALMRLERLRWICSRRVFPSASSGQQIRSKNSALARIKEKRALDKARMAAAAESSDRRGT